MALALANNGSAPGGAKAKADAVAEFKKMQLTRGGGTYIPPHRLRAMMADQEAEDKEGEAFQRMSWEALKKSINGLINKVNVANIKLLVPEVSLAGSLKLDRDTDESFRSIIVVRRELDPRKRSIRSIRHASPSLVAPLHSHFRVTRRDRQHETPSDRRAPPESTHPPIPSELQAKQQGTFPLAPGSVVIERRSS